MERLVSLAVAPVVDCGVMCAGGMVLAALGWRRSTCRSWPLPPAAPNRWGDAREPLHAER